MKIVAALVFALVSVAAAQEVAPSPSEIRPLLIGAAAPDSPLRTMDGTGTTLKAVLGGKPGVVIFYRGGWCPYCNAHLREIKSVQKKLAALGYATVAISPDRPEELQKTARKHALPYALLSDSRFDAARAFGVAYQLDADTLKKYATYGVDLRKASGEPHDWLPVPSVFLLGRDGTVDFVYANPDYRVRLKASVLIAAASAALEPPASPKP
jgi:peroxiredoxin